MEGQAKLTRTSSSLLRSPTVRSITSLSAVDEEEGNRSYDDDKKSQKPISSRSRLFSSSPSFSSSSLCRCSFSVFGSPFVPILFLFLSLFLFFSYFYLNGMIPSTANFVVAFAIMAAAFVLARRLILLRLGPERGVRKGESVEWFIGDVENTSKKVKANGDTSNTFWSERVVFYSNGDCYEGEFNNGKCNGNGVYNYSGHGRYEGDWVDGKYDGYGIESWTRGSRYRGQYKQGLRHGLGAFRFYTGDSYVGEWHHGQSHGVGVQTCSDGSCYVGEFKCGVKHGLGYYHFRNGDRYAGEYFGDRIHGFGVYHFVNDHRYEGSWHESRKQGYGTYTFRNGESKSGEWDYGVIKVPLHSNSEAVKRAVQAARRAAANAMLISGAGERVEKSIAAANRAATAARVAAIRAVQNQMEQKFSDVCV